MKYYAETVTAFQQPKTKLLNNSPNTGNSTPTSRVRRRFPFKTENSEDSLPMISPRVSPTEDRNRNSNGCYSPMNSARQKATMVHTQNHTQKLQAMTDVRATTPPNLQLTDKVKSARRDRASLLNDPTPESSPRIAAVRPISGSKSTQNPSKTVKIAPLSSEIKADLSALDLDKYTPDVIPPPPLKSCFKTVRKEFKRQLSRMNSW